MSDFYSFNIQYVSQKRTNWCWCACFSWIIKALNINNEYKEQWQILNYHSKNIKKERLSNFSENENEIKANSLFNYQIETQLNEVNELIEQCLFLDYEEINIPNYGDRKYEELKNILSFNNIKKLLKQNNAPIIITTSSHMILISGFGSNECGDFILISDPERGEEYIKPISYITSFKNEISKIWVLINKDGNALKKDAFIERITKETEGISDLSLEQEGFNTNPFNLLSFVNKVNSLLLNLNDNKISNFNKQLYSTIDYNIKNPFICEPSYRKNEVSNIRILSKLIKTYLLSTTENFNLNEFKIINKDESFTLMAEENDDILYGIINNKKINFNEAIKSITLNQY